MRDVVDHFVAVEAPVTFSDHSKPLHLSERFDEFNEYAGGKLQVHVATDLPAPRFNRWPTEIAQRNYISRALTQLGAVDDDLATITDADEIPSAEVVASIEIEGDILYQLSMLTFCYRLDLRIPELVSPASLSLSIRDAVRTDPPRVPVLSDQPWLHDPSRRVALQLPEHE